MGRRPKVIDLFAGAGFFSYGFQREGYELTCAVELDSMAAATYAKNLGHGVICEDVLKVEPFGRCDVLLAGPPCQGFSTLGKRDPNDPRNSLGLAVLPWVHTCRPSVVVVENVAIFLDSPVAQELRCRLSDAGYEVDAVVVNAADFGVPQYRQRSFIVASRCGMPAIQPAQRTEPTTVRQAWRGVPPSPDGVNWHCAPRPSLLAKARMRVVPLGGDKRDIMRNAPELAPPSWWRFPGAVTDVWGRMHWDAPSNTLRTAFQNPSKGRYIHPEQDRVITIREAARLQSVPDSYEFCGLPTQVARQVGNGVPPNLAMAIARAIKDTTF